MDTSVKFIGKGGRLQSFAISEADAEQLTRYAELKSPGKQAAERSAYSYKEIRNLAWTFLLQNKVSVLPVDLHAIIRRNGWTAVPHGHELLNYLDPNKRYAGLSACTYIFESCYIIVYDEKTPKPVLRYAMAHEFGHIELLHLIRETEKYESEAQQFAARILMPIIVLRDIGVDSPAAVAELCGVSLEAATFRFKRLQMLIRRGKFISPLEKQVQKQFERFVKDYKKQKGG